MEDRLSVTWIGTGTGVPSLARRGPCTLVRAGGLTLVVDLGLGALHGLLAEGVRHTDVDALLLTHLHPDHVSELAALLFASNYDEEPRVKALALVGGPGTASFVEALMSAHGRWVRPRGYELSVQEVEPGRELRFGALRCRAGGVCHLPSSLAYRLELAGRSLVLSGDTGPSEALQEFARAADLLVLEATLAPGDSMAEHLTAAEAGALARAAGAGRLVLNHLCPSAEGQDPESTARAAFGGPVAVATDGLRLDV